MFYCFIVILFWGLGIGDWGLGPIPNAQSPIPILYLTLKENKKIKK